MTRIPLEINQPEFLPIEIMILHCLLDKHEQYEAQGRDLEARGVSTAIKIVYQTLKGDFDSTIPSEWVKI